MVLRMTSFPIEEIRARFPALARRVGDRQAVFFDGPAGSQVPRSVADAICRAMLESNANLGGEFETSRECGEMIRAAQRAAADLLGGGAADEIVFGPNMTSLTFAVARALARTWQAGDEIVVTRLDKDANVTPWLTVAERAGVVVKHAGVVACDGTLDVDHLIEQLGPRTRLVAVAAASNLVGSIQPIERIVAQAHRVGAEVFVDAVHFAPHRAIDVAAWDCDYLVCSAYKFFGPHVGILWGRGARLAELPVDKLRPASDAMPDRWMPGTQNHEGIAGTLAAIDYLAELGRDLGDRAADRRAAVVTAFAAITAYESELCTSLLRGIATLDGVRVWGIDDPARMAERVPTVAIGAAGRSPREIAAALAERGFFVWSGHCYALPLTEALGLEPGGVLRIGLLHYNTVEEVRDLVDALQRVV